MSWEMNADKAQAIVEVRAFEPGECLVFDWGDENAMTTVDIRFSPWRDGGSFVEVTETGFVGDADSMSAYAADSTGGLTMVLCSLKALIEHDIDSAP